MAARLSIARGTSDERTERVPGAGIEPARPFRDPGFSSRYGFRRLLTLHRAVCGLDCPFTVPRATGFRCRPSSLYTVLARLCAEAWLGITIAGFPDFEQFYSTGFPMGTQVVVTEVLCVCQFRHPGGVGHDSSSEERAGFRPCAVTGWQRLWQFRQPARHRGSMTSAGNHLHQRGQTPPNMTTRPHRFPRPLRDASPNPMPTAFSARRPFSFAALTGLEAGCDLALVRRAGRSL